MREQALRHGERGERVQVGGVEAGGEVGGGKGRVEQVGGLTGEARGWHWMKRCLSCGQRAQCVADLNFFAITTTNDDNS